MILAYDGTSYFGWQRQNNFKSIQGELEKSLKAITGKNTSVIGAGRTDAGVHALGQVANFRIDTHLQSDIIKRALNANLPKEIRVLDVGETTLDFHAQKCAKGKRYAYQIFLGKETSPFCRTYFAQVGYKLSIERMRESAKRIIGKKDFKALSTNPGYSLNSTVRTVEHIHISKKRNLLWIVVQGKGFLYNMVRTIAGTLVDAGRGRFSPDDIERIIKEKDRRKAGPVMPASGLFLVRVLYEKKWNIPKTRVRHGTVNVPRDFLEIRS